MSYERENSMDVNGRGKTSLGGPSWADLQAKMGQIRVLPAGAKVEAFIVSVEGDMAVRRDGVRSLEIVRMLSGDEPWHVLAHTDLRPMIVGRHKTEDEAVGHLRLLAGQPVAFRFGPGIELEPMHPEADEPTIIPAKD